MAAAPLLLLLLLVPVPLLPLLAQGPGGALGNRHAVYWNSSNQQIWRAVESVKINKPSPPPPLSQGGGAGVSGALILPYTTRPQREDSTPRTRGLASPGGTAARSLGGARAGGEEGKGPVSLQPAPVPFAPARREAERDLTSLRREGYTVQVNVNDYLDIYCPHYNSSGVGPGAGPGPGGGAEQYVLYMVSQAGYHTCNASQGFKRWECNRPHAPHSPIKFSEKFQRYSAFSLGYEFHAGHEYYYISTPTHLHWKCLRMKVFVCCASTSHSGEKPVPTLPQFTMGPNVKINVLEDFEGENRQVPKLEKSISGTSPKREHLPLAMGIAFFLMTLWAS
ncbi:ephrin-A3 [Tenrec ecaudatus]|uniref:ephrin-A3 n=1 Tax=Tenrec ecaudatus TaxID=94439 RepID=UPI003F59827B